MNEKEKKRISKFLSLVLRHQPEQIGLRLDKQGWAEVDALLLKSGAHGIPFDLDMLKEIVETNDKKRFAFSADYGKIRASQGHSIEVDLGYVSQEPPETLFHGTAEKSVESIRRDGLDKRSRQHVHLSQDFETAVKVGQRHGVPFVFRVRAKEIFDLGFEFYISQNGVWLTDKVPKEFLFVESEEFGKEDTP